jgi:hypothetical protein
LARELHAASDACGGIGIEEGRQDFEAERVVEQYSSLGRQAEQADGGSRARIEKSGVHQA